MKDGEEKKKKTGINARRRHPNERIVFIKPLEGPDKAVAQDFLERVAAIVVPVCMCDSKHLPTA